MLCTCAYCMYTMYVNYYSFIMCVYLYLHRFTVYVCTYPYRTHILHTCIYNVTIGLYCMYVYTFMMCCSKSMTVLIHSGHNSLYTHIDVLHTYIHMYIYITNVALTVAVSACVCLVYTTYYVPSSVS